MGPEGAQVLQGLAVGIRNILIEADGECAIQMIAKGCSTVNACYHLICDIKGLMDRNWLVVLHHVYRESNNAADFMASHALKLPLGVHIFAFPPPASRDLYLAFV
ncbi:hypothetical protein WN943_022642 [Citrus x changshan-huyou]